MTSTAPAAFNQKKRIFTLWLLATIFLAVFIFCSPLWGDDSGIHGVIETLGIGLVFAAILGRLWSILYIGARKNEELVTIGPYSMTRNPLYVFSLIGIAGIGLMFGSIILTVLLVTACTVVFYYTSLREAAFLRGKFGSVYDAYAASTPLMLPRFSAYRSAAEVTFSQKALTTTFLDCLFLLALFPIIEGVEYLQTSGYLPVFFHIP